MSFSDRIPVAVVRSVTAAAYAAIGVASLVPKTLRPSSGLVPGPVEHFAAYLVLGVVAAAALRGKIGLGRLAVLNAAYAGCLELAQLIVPGRVGAPIDFFASALGSGLGIAGIALLVRKQAARP